MDNEYLDIIGLGIFKALNDKRYPILVNGKISESAIPTSITNSITSILSLIPDAASSENKLADKNFVNSSIATNTATFRGTFDDLATLQATSADINDYAFYVHTDEIGNTAYDRYKHNGSTWVFEYTLNNSSFTAEQWSAINSGITTTKVGNYDAHLINYSNPHKVTKSQVGLGLVENVAISTWKGSENITTLGTITKGTWKGTKIGNDYLANSSITIGTTAISLGSTAKSLAGIEKLQLNDANSNLVYDSTTGSWKLTGNLLVTGFISAGAKGTSGGGSSTYTQKEWAQIKDMTATASGSLASAYAVKEAYSEAKTLIDANTGNITSLTSRVTTLEGKATAVSFSQTLTSGTKIGAITVDGTTTNIYAPTLASQMGSTAIGGTSSYLYWNGSAWATKALGSNAFTSISKVSQLTNDSGYITGITKSMVEGVLTGNITSHSHSNYVDLTSYQTITGNKNFSGAIQVGAIGINTDNVGLYGYGEDAVEIHAENILTLCGERNTYIGNADNSAMVDIQEDMAGYNAETGVETWHIYRDGYAEFQSISGSLANSLAIKLNGGTTEGTNLFTFNNSASKTINITPSAIGAAAASHTHSYLPLTGGTVTGALTINTYIDSSFILDEPTGEKYHKISFRASGEEYAYLLADNHSSENKLVFNGSTILHSGNVGNYALPLSGGTLTGSVTMQGMNTNLIRNITYTSTSSWARGLINLQVDGVSKFSISALGDYTLGASDNGINYAYIGCNSYDGLNLRISATSLSWGDNSILHSGNYNSYALPLGGGTINSGTFRPLVIDSSYNGITELGISNKTTIYSGFGYNNGYTFIGREDGGGYPKIGIRHSDNTPVYSPNNFKTIHTLIHSGNYNSYAPKLDGTGATGTWNININGYAGALCKYINITDLNVPSWGLTDGYSINYNTCTHTVSNAPSAVNNANLIMNIQNGLHGSSGQYGWQVGFFNSLNSPYVRIWTAGRVGAWYKLLHSGNYNEFAPSLTGVGASGTWGISISGNAASASTLYTTKIAATSSSIVYYKISGILNTSITTTIFRITTRNSESYLLYVNKDDNKIVAPRITRERNMYSKIISFAWSGQDLYIKADSYSNGIYITQINGTAISYNVTTTDESTYNSATSIAIDESAFLTSNVASATKLANSRTIWGQSFDGTGDVSGALTGVTSITASGNATIAGNVIIGTTNDSGFKLGVFGGRVLIFDSKRRSLNSTCIADSALLHLSSFATKNDGLFFGQMSDSTSWIQSAYYGTSAQPSSNHTYNLSLNPLGGNVGIGTTSPSYKLHIAGALYSSAGLITDGAISAAKTSTSSDIRLKDNISEIGSKTALQWLSMLKPKSWTWNDKAGVTGQSMGFVAQDVEGILPQMVKKQDNGYLSLDYTQLHALEVTGLQDHEKRIEELERENKILKEELNKLKLNAN